MLTDLQKALLTSIAKLVGTIINTVIKLTGNNTNAQVWKDFIHAEIDTALTVEPSSNPVKDVVEAVLDTTKQIDANLPDGTKGKKSLASVITIITGIVHMFGL